MKSAIYAAGCLVSEVEAVGVPKGIAPNVLADCAQSPGRVKTILGYCWGRAKGKGAVDHLIEMAVDAPGYATPDQQSFFWVGYYHQKIARELPPSFPARLTALRTSAGLSIPDLARKSGLSDDAIRRYESGDPKRPPTWASVQKLAAALGVPTDAFRQTQE